MHKVMDTVREMKASGKLSGDAADSLLAPIIEAAKTGSVEKMAGALHEVVMALQQMKGITPPKEEIVWTKDELDRQEKMLSLKEREIRLQMERRKAEEIATPEKSSSASTADAVPRLQSLINQRRAMLEDAHKQGAISEDEYSERSLKLDEDKFKLQQEINADFRASAKGRDEVLDEELQKKRESLALDRQAAQDSFALTPQEKLQSARSLLQIEKQYVDELRQYYEWEAKNAAFNKDAVANAEATRKARGLESEGSRIDRQVTGLNAQANPNSLSDQFKVVTTQIRAMPTLAQGAAATFKNTFETAITSISRGISGLIEGTMRWGQALRMIGTTIIESLIQGIVQMAVQWVLTHIIMAGVSQAFNALLIALGWSSATAATSQQATQTPLPCDECHAGERRKLWHGIRVGRGCFGRRPGHRHRGGGGAYSEGGFTGSGGKYDVAGIVHRGEYVMPTKRRVAHRVGES